MNLMKNISLAIPTYNSSKYLEELFISCFDSFKEIPFNEVVINDDKSNEEEFKKIISLVNIYSSKYSEINFEINQNNKNLGGFRNKYLTVKKCSNNVIYQIDSDNLIRKSTIKLLEKSTFENNFLFIPSNIYLFNKFKRGKSFSHLDVSPFGLENSKYNDILKKSGGAYNIFCFFIDFFCIFVKKPKSN